MLCAVIEESHSSSAVSCKDYFHLGINPLVAVTDNPAFRLQTNHSFNETCNIGGLSWEEYKNSFVDHSNQERISTSRRVWFTKHVEEVLTVCLLRLYGEVSRRN